MSLVLFVRISNEVVNEGAKVVVVSEGILITVCFGGHCLLCLQDGSQTSPGSKASLHASYDHVW